MKFSENEQKNVNKRQRYSQIHRIFSCHLSQSNERVEEHVFKRMAETLDKHVRTSNTHVRYGAHSCRCLVHLSLHTHQSYEICVSRMC